MVAVGTLAGPEFDLGVEGFSVLNLGGGKADLQDELERCFEAACQSPYLTLTRLRFQGGLVAGHHYVAPIKKHRYLLPLTVVTAWIDRVQSRDHRLLEPDNAVSGGWAQNVEAHRYGGITGSVGVGVTAAVGDANRPLESCTVEDGSRAISVCRRL